MAQKENKYWKVVDEFLSEKAPGFVINCPQGEVTGVFGKKAQRCFVVASV